MTGEGNLDALDPPEHSVVALADGSRVKVRSLPIVKLPAFARALKPLSEHIGKLIAQGLTAGSLLELVGDEDNVGHVIAALEVATGADRKTIEQGDIEQTLELLLAVLQANRNFFKGRMATALRMAAAVSGSGLTRSKSSSGTTGASKQRSRSTSSS